MNRVRRGIAFSAAALALAGCAALEVSVDVYKGPLIDPHRLRTEQLGAMAMGAKPLLVNLRSIFEADCRETVTKHVACSDYGFAEKPGTPNPESLETPFSKDCTNGIDRDEVMPDECFVSWRARRVNAILGLYKPANRSAGEYLSSLRSLQEKLAAGSGATRNFMLALVGESTLPELKRAKKLPSNPETISQNYQAELRMRLGKLVRSLQEQKNRSREDAEILDAARALLGLPEDSLPRRYSGEQIHRLQGRLIADFPKHVQDSFRQMRNQMLAAWKYACELLSDPAFRESAGSEGTLLVAETAATLTGFYFLADAASGPLDLVHGAVPGSIPKELRQPAEATVTDRELRVQVLTRALAGIGGERTAATLLRINQNLAEKDTSNSNNPRDLVAFPGLRPFLEQVRGIKDRVDASVATALGGGRREIGLERLIEDYLAGQDAYDRLPREKRAEALDGPNGMRAKRWRLIYALIDFGQKVAYMANFEALLPVGTVPDSVRLLQAVGNSIMNQISDYKRWDEFDRAQLANVSTQQWALRGAAGAASGQTLLDLERQISAEGGNAMEKRDLDALLKKLRGGGKSLQEAIQGIEVQRKKVGDTSEKAAGELNADRKVRELLGNSTFKAALETAGAKGSAIEKKNMMLAAAAKWFNDQASKQVPKEAGLAIVIARASAQLDKARKSRTSPKSVDELVDSLIKAADSAIELGEQSVKGSREREARVGRWLELARAGDPTGGWIGFPGDAKLEFKESKQVLDALVTGLQNQYVFETRAGLTDRAQRTKQAIAAANAYRSGMVFIRPAAIFLRDSYPATILQDDPTSQRDLLRVRTPFQHDVLTPNQKAQQIIDKQFWQTVNHISLSGAGKTNYVLTKDDIGNWYVKGYSSDPGQIYQSARNLLLFAATAKSQAQALTGRELGDGAKSTGLTAGSPYDRSLLKRQFDSAANSYEGDLRNSLLAARKAARDMQKYLRAAGKEAVAKDVVDTIVADPSDAAFAAVKDMTDEKLKPGTDTKRADNFPENLSLIEAMRAYRTQALANIKANSSATDATKLKPDTDESKDEAKLVKAALDKKAGSIIDSAMGSLEQAMSRFEQRLRFALDTASEPVKSADAQPGQAAAAAAAPAQPAAPAKTP